MKRQRVVLDSFSDVADFIKSCQTEANISYGRMRIEGRFNSNAKGTVKDFDGKSFVDGKSIFLRLIHDLLMLDKPFSTQPKEDCFPIEWKKIA